MEHTRQELGRQRRPAGVGAPQRIPQVARIAALQEVPRSAGAESVEEVLVVLGDSQHHDSRLRMLVQHPGSRGDPAAGHVDVEQAHIGSRLSGSGHRSLRIGRLCTDVKPFPLEDPADGRPDRRVVVGDEDADCRGHGSATSTVVPPAVPCKNESVAPIRAARVLMLAMPK